MLNKLFKEHDEEIIQNFEIIFDISTCEKTAKEKAFDYCRSLIDEDIEIDIEEIVSLAESYGYNFDDFSKFVINYLDGRTN
jgi:hypothetical protein